MAERWKKITVDVCAVGIIGLVCAVVYATVYYYFYGGIERTLKRSPELRRQVQAAANELITLNETKGTTVWTRSDPQFPKELAKLGVQSIEMAQFGGAKVVRLNVGRRLEIIMFPLKWYQRETDVRSVGSFHSVGDNIVVIHE
jgi:hypothetical protein